MTRRPCVVPRGAFCSLTGGCMYKTHQCGELRATHVENHVTLAGWIHRRRDHGGLTFLDLRDRFGVVQVVANPAVSADAHSTAITLRPEWVVQVEGVVRRRPSGMENPTLPTGEVEVEAHRVHVLNPAKTPPFPIHEETEVDETLRLKYRYLDLRRARMQHNLLLRHRIANFIRDYLAAHRL